MGTQHVLSPCPVLIAAAPSSYSGHPKLYPELHQVNMQHCWSLPEQIEAKTCSLNPSEQLICSEQQSSAHRVSLRSSKVAGRSLPEFNSINSHFRGFALQSDKQPWKFNRAVSVKQPNKSPSWASSKPSWANSCETQCRSLQASRHAATPRGTAKKPK